jgi:hypothetical protein
MGEHLDNQAGNAIVRYCFTFRIEFFFDLLYPFENPDGGNEPADPETKTYEGDRPG